MWILFFLLFLVGELGLNADFFELLDEIATAMHLQQYVATADELALEKYLRYGGPIRVFLNSASYLLVLEYVVTFERSSV